MSSPEVVIQHLESILRQVRVIENSLLTLDIPLTGAFYLGAFKKAVEDRLKDIVYQQHIEKQREKTPRIPSDVGLDAVGTDVLPSKAIQTKTCSNCGAQILVGAQQCPHCEVKQPPSTPPQQPQPGEEY